MQIKVLVVDDSRFYRNRLREIFADDSDIQLIGTAENGREAIEKVAELKPDVVTMDIEMPVMDGIAAVREIMKTRPVPILMFSSLTAKGAHATLEALDAGAADFMLKRLEDMAHSQHEFVREIREKIRALARRPLHAARAPLHKNDFAPRLHEPREPARQAPRSVPSGKASLADYKLVAIGASTGGPSALQQIISALPKGFPIPVLVIQHMPAAFTGPFARRLDAMSQVEVKEAEDGDALLAGKVFIAPGGKQMLVEDHSGRGVIRIRESGENEQYRPSVDVGFRSIADAYGKNVLAIVLTGMGADGREGARLLKKGGSSVWAQDEQSCVVYGMPQAVVAAGLADRVFPLSEIAHKLASGA